jgi:hypothetical protein
MIDAREYKTAKFPILNPPGVPCACGRVNGVAADPVPGLPTLSADLSWVL